MEFVSWNTLWEMLVLDGKGGHGQWREESAQHKREGSAENQRIRRWQGTSVLWRILYSVCDVILN